MKNLAHLVKQYDNIQSSKTYNYQLKDLDNHIQEKLSKLTDKFPLRFQTNKS